MAIQISNVTVIDSNRQLTNIAAADATTVASLVAAGVVTTTATQTLTNKTIVATSATKLATARTIGGVSFDGTANINLPGVNAAGSQDTSGNAATATKLATAVTIGGVSFDGSLSINLPGVNATGNQDTSGNAATATRLATARTINGTSFNGTANITVPVNTSPKSDAIEYNIPFVSSVTSGNQSLYTDSIASLKYNPSTNTLTVPTIVADLTGNASTAASATTATTLATARAINGTNFDGSASITTSSWGTSRNLTIGSTAKAVNGSVNVAWSLAEIGAAATSHTHAAGDITSGTMATARLGSGTASTSTWLRGDSSWQALPVASTTVDGIVTTGAQQFSGTKRFQSPLVIPDGTEAQLVVEKTGTSANYSYLYNNGTHVGVHDLTGAKGLFSVNLSAAAEFNFNSGFGVPAAAYGCRAWVNFNGTGTLAIRGSGNVSSVTDNGTGAYTVNFANAMPDVNYCVSLAGTDVASGQDYPKIQTATSHATAPTTMTTTAVRVGGNTSSDWNVFCVAIFR